MFLRTTSASSTSIEVVTSFSCPKSSRLRTGVWQNVAFKMASERGDLNADTIKYFMVKDSKFARFHLLPKIHKRLHDVPGHPVTKILHKRY